MDEIIATINAVYKTISLIPVSGDYVDTMAIARAQLRKARSELKKIKAEVASNGNTV